MYVKIVGGQVQWVVVVVGEGFIVGDGQGLFDDLLWIVMYCVVKLLWCQLVVWQVGVIGEGFEQQWYVGFVGQFQFVVVVGQGQYYQWQVFVIGGVGVEYGVQQFIIVDQVVVQCVMWFDIGYLGIEGMVESVQCVDLVQYYGMYFFGRVGQ